jgi:hypothetical protein
MTDRSPTALLLNGPHVRRMAAGTPTRLPNNTLQGFSGLTARFT